MLHAHLLSACKYSGDHSVTCRLDPQCCHSDHLSPVNNLSALNWMPARRRCFPLPAPHPPQPPSRLPSTAPNHRFSINYLFTQLESVHLERGPPDAPSERRWVGGGRGEGGRREGVSGCGHTFKLQKEKKIEQVAWSASSQLAAALTRPEAALNVGRVEARASRKVLDHVWRY